jgi:hypothetical protein
MPAAGDITVQPELAVPPRRIVAGGQPLEPLFVYPPDKRRVFKDTTFPWRACGRVVTPTGAGAGALVGPRHILTASHLIQWLPGNNAGWVLFQPDYYDSDVFPSSYASSISSYEQIGTPASESALAEDFVVCVLNDRLGDQLGGFGTLEYDDSWDGGSYWNHVGYPTDVGGGSKPAWELFFSIKNSWHPGYFEAGRDRDIETFASLTPGDSGGPVFGYWTDSPAPDCPPGPYIVAVVSSQGTLPPVYSDNTDRTANWLAGGAWLPRLVQTTLDAYP